MGWEYREEKRLKYSWCVWFAEDWYANLAWAEMLNVSSGGMGIICSADENCPHKGQTLVFYFSVPCRAVDGSVDRVCFARVGQVCGVTEINESAHRVHIQFDKPLPFKPEKQLADKTELTKLEAMVT